MGSLDRFDVAVAGDRSSADVWDQAFALLLAYSGDPLTALADVNAHDDGFALGPAFCAAYRMLGGMAPDDPDVAIDVTRACTRARDDRERAAADAVALMAAGQWVLACERLDDHVKAAPRDLFAQKLSHDLCLHSGNLARRLHRAHAALAGWGSDEQGFGVAAGHLSFALEEAGRYDEAERWGMQALAVEPGDAWARHAMAHTFESQQRDREFVAVLTDAGEHWHDRSLFANHLWWHVALRRLHAGDPDAALEVADHRLVSTTAFGLCDTTSLVWRLDLAGHDVTTRWQALAELWSEATAVHHAAFVDLHAAMVFATVPGPAADRFFDELTARTAAPPGSENDRTFAEIVAPFTDLVRNWRGTGGRPLVPDALDALGDKLWHVGGSVIQRQVMHDTIARGSAAT